MLALSLALVATLMSLGWVCADPAVEAVEKKQRDCVDCETLEFVVSNGLGGNYCYKPKSKCNVDFSLYVALEGSTELQKLACAKPGKSDCASIEAKKVAAAIFTIPALGKSVTIFKKELLANRRIAGTCRIESVAVPFETDCSGGVGLNTNFLNENDRPLFPKAKGKDCGGTCFSR